MIICEACVDNGINGKYSEPCKHGFSVLLERGMDMVISLDLYQSVAIAALVYYLGKFITKKVKFFATYCIPAPVIGGMIFALLALVLRVTGVLSVEMDTTLQDVFMTVFFTSVGFTACFRLLKKGGIQVFIFLLVVVALVLMQDVIGVTLARLLNLNPLLGLCTASIPMVGGHATAGSFGPLIERLGVSGASTVAIASATFGLVAGGVIGGPLARRRIDRLHLAPTPEGVAAYREQEQDDPKVRHVEVYHFMDAVCVLFLAMGLGTIISNFFTSIGLTFPSYIGAMLSACLLRNLCDLTKKKLPEREIDVCGNVSLSLFLSMALMGLKLWELSELALPMIILLLAQVIVMSLFAYFVVFNVMGRDYEAAVMTTACCGFGLGATPNAMANMQAVTGEFGPAPKAFFIVPLVGSLFIDFLNSTIITGFINFLT